MVEKNFFCTFAFVFISTIIMDDYYAENIV